MMASFLPAPYWTVWSLVPPRSSLPTRRISSCANACSSSTFRSTAAGRRCHLLCRCELHALLRVRDDKWLYMNTCTMSAAPYMQHVCTMPAAYMHHNQTYMQHAATPIASQIWCLVQNSRLMDQNRYSTVR